MWWRPLLAVVVGCGAFVGFVALGYAIFDAVALPDLCDYHNKEVEPNWLFDLYFPTTATSGFHPEPGNVFLLTALVGGIGMGVLSYRWFCGLSKRP